MKTKASEPRRGFTLIELMIVVVALVILGLAWLPAIAKNKPKPERIACTNRLKSIGLAFRLWANDNQEKFPTTLSATNNGVMETLMNGNVAAVFQIMSNELSTPKILLCPADKNRVQATTFSSSPQQPFSNSNLSYFVGMDADLNSPSTFLSGDDNFLVGGNRINLLSGAPVQSGILSLRTNDLIAWSETRHVQQGNVGLADGSVQWFSTAALRGAIGTAGVETTRLVMP